MSLYNVEVLKVGEYASEALDDGMLILFNKKAPADVAEFCFIHNHDELKGEIIIGCNVVIDGVTFSVTAVGSAVNQNLGNLGHITLRFDSADTAEYPGSLHLDGNQPEPLMAGSTLTFY